MVLVDSFSAGVPVEFRIYLLKYADKMVRRGGDYFVGAGFLKELVEVVLEGVQQEREQVGAGVSSVQQVCLGLMSTLKQSYFGTLSDKAVIRTQEWLVQELMAITKGEEFLGPRESKKLVLLLDIVECLVHGQTPTSTTQTL